MKGLSKIRKPALSNLAGPLVALFAALSPSQAHAFYLPGIATDFVQALHVKLHAGNWFTELENWKQQLFQIEAQLNLQNSISAVLGVSGDLARIQAHLKNFVFEFNSIPYSIQNDLNSLQDASKYTFNHLRDSFNPSANSTTSRFGTGGHFLSAQDMHQRASSLRAQFASKFLQDAPTRQKDYTTFQEQQDSQRTGLYSQYDNTVKLQGAKVQHEITGNEFQGKMIERMDRSEERASYDTLTEEAARQRQAEIAQSRTSFQFIKTHTKISQWEQ